MEPSGRNRRQPLANAPGKETTQKRRSATGRNPRNKQTFDGKEVVDGSSPSEGSAKAPHVGAFPYVFSRREGS